MNIKNAYYTGAAGRNSLIDLEIPSDWNEEVLVFIHGFMGFKDWGAWNLVQAYFVGKGFGFCKFNLSHNGATTACAEDFPDKEAFAQNRYSYEVEDVKCATKWLEQHVSTKKIHLIGHSRGGGVALLAAKHITNIASITTWAAISCIENRFPKGEELDKWRQDGVRFVQNSRTKETLPQYYSLYTDFKEYQEDTSIDAAIRELTIPVCLIHGSDDEAVSIEDGRQLASWGKVSLHEIAGANHVFGAAHPYTHAMLPEHLSQVCYLTLQAMFSVK